MNKIEIPIPNKDIMITYKKAFYSGAYSLNREVRTITKRGFYSDLFNNFSIPPEYRKFNGVLLPHGFGGDHIDISEVINWTYCDET